MITTATAQGLRPYQEDRSFIVSTSEGVLFGVLDGHGGAEVSDLLERALPQLWKETRGSRVDVHQRFTNVFAKASELTRYMPAGSTASVAFIPKNEKTATVAVLGDSPIIAERVGGGVFIGASHNARSNSEERAAAEKRGGVYIDGYICADFHSGGLQMTRSFGDFELDAILDRTPEINTFALGDFLLIGSDGLLDPTHSDESAGDALLQAILSGGTPAQLVNRAIAMPTHDNVTALMWRRRLNKKEKRPCRKQSK